MQEKENSKPLSIEQAINKIVSEKDNKPAEIKKESEAQDISVALPEDRRKFLLYAITLLDNVDGDIMRFLPENIRMMYSGREMAIFFKGFLRMKVDYYSNQQIAKELGVTPNIIDNIEFLALEAAKRSIDRAKIGKIPIVGVN